MFGLDQAAWLRLTGVLDWVGFSTVGRTTVGTYFPDGALLIWGFRQGLSVLATVFAVMLIIGNVPLHFQGRHPEWHTFR